MTLAKGDDALCDIIVWMSHSLQNLLTHEPYLERT